MTDWRHMASYTLVTAWKWHVAWNPCPGANAGILIKKIGHNNHNTTKKIANRGARSSSDGLLS